MPKVARIVLENDRAITSLRYSIASDITALRSQGRPKCSSRRAEQQVADHRLPHPGQYSRTAM